VKSTLYLTAKVLAGNKIEIQNLNLTEGQTVEVVIIISESNTSISSENNQSPSLEERQTFLKLPLSHRRRILETQAETMLSHYQQDSEWQELMAGDIIDY
jgi:predicted DNA-binding antitoxin AbrB/MazE fold protein